MIIEELDIETLYGTYRLVETENPVCEVCDKEFEIAYVDHSGRFLGCDRCVDVISSWEIE